MENRIKLDFQYLKPLIKEQLDEKEKDIKCQILIKIYDYILNCAPEKRHKKLYYISIAKLYELSPQVEKECSQPFKDAWNSKVPFWIARLETMQKEIGAKTLPEISTFLLVTMSVTKL